MAILPVTTAARLLGLHPKTLRRWLLQAHVPLLAHPTDARICCVAAPSLLSVARAHGRPLPDLAPALLLQNDPPHTAQEEFVPVEPIQEAESPLPVATLPTSRREEEWLEQLSSLQTKVATLQDQVTQLALALLQQRDHPLEQRLSALETLWQASMGSGLCAPPLSDGPATAPSNGSLPQVIPPPVPHPGEQRRQLLPPLIEYGAAGTYVVLCPEEGKRSLLPDSPPWFAWLASLSSFRFVGKSGRLSACRVRDHGPKRTWYAYRYFHQHTYKHYLGTTDHLTIDCLEQMAAKLQSYVNAI